MVIFLAACAALAGVAAEEGANDAALRVVATTGMIADAVAVVGGERVAVTGLMGPGIDPHLHKASAGDVRALEQADIIFLQRAASRSSHGDRSGTDECPTPYGGCDRRHRLVEQFLTKILGYTWDEVHSEAERMKHAVSSLFVKWMAQAPGEPPLDSHGDPIPAPNFSLPKQDCIPLVDLAAGQKAVVRRVLCSEPGMLRSGW